MLKDVLRSASRWRNLLMLALGVPVFYMVVVQGSNAFARGSFDFGWVLAAGVIAWFAPNALIDARFLESYETRRVEVSPTHAALSVSIFFALLAVVLSLLAWAIFGMPESTIGSFVNTWGHLAIDIGRMSPVRWPRLAALNVFALATLMASTTFLPSVLRLHKESYGQQRLTLLFVLYLVALGLIAVPLPAAQQYEFAWIKPLGWAAVLGFQVALPRIWANQRKVQR